MTWIQNARGHFDGIVVNPAGYTHTSTSQFENAIAAVALPTVEVHLSNIHQREEFRHHSFIAGVALGQISDLGPTGYLLALDGLLAHLNSRQRPSRSRPASNRKPTASRR